MSADFFGLDKYGRPNLPPFNKIWFEDGGYKGFIYRLDKERFYFNNIPVPAESYWETLTGLAYGGNR